MTPNARWIIEGSLGGRAMIRCDDGEKGRNNVDVLDA
jgi:hypothetical protein